MNFRELRQYEPVELVEDDTDAGLTMMHFQVLQGGISTGNGRVYSNQVLSKAAQDFTTRIEKQGPNYGSLGHVKILEVNDVSHIIKGVKFDEKTGKLWATAAILPTTQGANLHHILRAGGKVGVSARGVGETDAEGNVKNYSLNGIDMTLNPSTDNWIGKECFESVALDEEQMDIIEIRFREALKAGYQGTRIEYIEEVYKPNLKMREDMAAKRSALNEETPEVPGEIYDEPISDDEELALIETMTDVVKKQLGKDHKVMAVDKSHVFTFNQNLSTHYSTPYKTTSSGEIQLGSPSTPIDFDEE